MLNRKPIESRYIREVVVKPIIELFPQKLLTEEIMKAFVNEYQDKVPCLLSVGEERHPRMSVCLFEMESKGESFYIMGYALCNEEDNFSYDMGKEVSADRAYKRAMEIKDKSLRILPSEKDLERIPKKFRNEFVDICSEFYKKYGNGLN